MTLTEVNKILTELGLIMELLIYEKPSDLEIAQRWAKIFINSCYDRIIATSKFELYDVKNNK